MAVSLIMLLISAICFLLATLDIQANRAIPAGLFFLTMYFLVQRGI